MDDSLQAGDGIGADEKWNRFQSAVQDLQSLEAEIWGIIKEKVAEPPNYFHVPISYNLTSPLLGKLDGYKCPEFVERYEALLEIMPVSLRDDERVEGRLDKLRKYAKEIIEYEARLAKLFPTIQNWSASNAGIFNEHAEFLFQGYDVSKARARKYSRGQMDGMKSEYYGGVSRPFATCTEEYVKRLRSFYLMSRSLIRTVLRLSKDVSIQDFEEVTALQDVIQIPDAAALQSAVPVVSDSIPIIQDSTESIYRGSVQSYPSDVAQVNELVDLNERLGSRALRSDAYSVYLTLGDIMRNVLKVLGADVFDQNLTPTNTGFVSLINQLQATFEKKPKTSPLNSAEKEMIVEFQSQLEEFIGNVKFNKGIK